MRILSAALATALFAGMTFGAAAAPSVQGVKAQSTFELIKSKHHKKPVKKPLKKHHHKKHHAKKPVEPKKAH